MTLYIAYKFVVRVLIQRKSAIDFLFATNPHEQKHRP